MKDPQQSALKAGLWYTIGNIITKGINFLTLPLFTMLMTTDQYGLFGTFASYLSIFAVFFSLGLPASVRNARYDFPEDEKNYHKTSALLILLTFTVALGIFLPFRGAFGRLFGMSALLTGLALICALGNALLSYYNDVLSLDYLWRNILAISFYYTIFGTLIPLLMIRFVFPEQAALGRALGFTIPQIIGIIYILFRIFSARAARPGKKYAVYGLRFGIPLIPNELAMIILVQFDRIMIFKTLGETPAGLYGLAYNFSNLYQSVIIAVQSAWGPWMFSMLNARRIPELKLTIRKILVLLTFGTSLLILVCPEIVRLITDSDYWGAIPAIAPLILSMFFYALSRVPANVQLYHKKTNHIFICTTIAALVNIVTNAIFIPRYGFVAAAWTTLASYFLHALLYAVIASRLERLPYFTSPTLWLSLLFLAGITTISLVFLGYVWLRLSIAAILLLLGGVVCLIRRSEISALLHSILKGDPETERGDSDGSDERM